MSKLNQQIYEQIEEWRNRPIEGEFPYVYLDGTVLKRSWAGEVKNVSVLVAIGVNADGYREVLGVAEGAKEDKAGWSGFLRYLKDARPDGGEAVHHRQVPGAGGSAWRSIFPEARWQRCVVHFYRNVFTVVPKGKVREVAAMLKAIHAQEDREAATAEGAAVAEKLRGMRLAKAAGAA